MSAQDGAAATYSASFNVQCIIAHPRPQSSIEKDFNRFPPIINSYIFMIQISEILNFNDVIIWSFQS